MRVLSLILLVPAVALGQTVSCPSVLPQGSVEVVRTPPGWFGFSPSQSRLDGGGMMSGPPQQMAYLVPASSRKVKGAGIATGWQFAAGEEKWLYCTYGTNAIQVAKRMDDKTTECTMTSREERKGVIAELTAVCK
jgi:hypothetical protein